MPKTKRFDETDRQFVLQEVQRHGNVRLLPVGRRRKWYRDASGRSYWILGGYGQWHGIPAEMMEAEAHDPSGGVVVIAVKDERQIAIYLGLLKPLVDGRADLYRASKTTGDYQFTYQQRGTHLLIDQIPAATLEHVGTYEFGATERERASAMRDAEREFRNLPDEHRKALLSRLRRDVEGTDPTS